MKKRLTQQQVAATIATWAERLELLHWHFAVNFNGVPDDDEPDAWEAKVNVATDYNRATITLNKKVWPTWTQEKLERIVVHELIHCIMEPLFVTATSETMKEQLGATAWDLYNDRLLHELEHAVDSLAHAIVVNWNNDNQQEA